MANLGDREMKDLLFELAEFTLCQKEHQYQADEVSTKWYRTVRSHLDVEEQRFRDASASSRGSDDDYSSDDDSDIDSDINSGDDSSDNDNDSDSDDSDGDVAVSGAELPDNTANVFNELQQRLDEIARLQRDFEQLRDRLMNSPSNRGRTSTAPLRQPQISTPSNANSSSSDEETRQCERRARAQRTAEVAEARRQAEARRETEARRAAEEARREEALKQAREAAAAERVRLQREREKREAEAERARQHREQERLRREREARRKRSEEEQLWESAWAKYEAAWSSIAYANVQLDDADIRAMGIWPTKSGLYSSCCEVDVEEFFAHRPERIDRKALRRQFMRWHPDRAERLFSHVREKNGVLEMMTMVSQVVTAFMGTCSV